MICRSPNGRGHLKGSGKVNTKWIRKNKDTEGRDIHLREIKDSEIPAPTDEGLTDGDIDPIGCADCDPKISILQASRDTQPEEWSESNPISWRRTIKAW